MVHQLHTKEAEAVVLDKTTVEYLVATDAHCELHKLGDIFDPYYIAMAFPPDADDELVLQFSTWVAHCHCCITCLTPCCLQK
jgi:hypothetical protein